MPDVYAVSSAKGGVGKTTTAVNLAATLAAAGHDVVAVDADLGTPNFAAALGMQPGGATIHELLAGEATLAEATYEGPHGLRVVPGRDDLSAFREADPGRLASVIDTVTDADYVIVDTSAGLTHDSALPLSVADGTLLVATPDRDALAATRKSAHLTTQLGGTIAGVALNRAEPDDTAEGIDAPVIAWIPDSPLLAEACAAAEPITTYAPASGEAAAYRRLASRLAVARVPPPPGTEDARTADERDTEPSEYRRGAGVAAGGAVGAASGAGGAAGGPGGAGGAQDERGDAADTTDETDGATDEHPGAAANRPTAADGAVERTADGETQPQAGDPSVDETDVDDILGRDAADTAVTEPNLSGESAGTETGDASATDATGDAGTDDTTDDGQPATSESDSESADDGGIDTGDADGPSVLSRGEGDDEMIVAAGSEMEAKEEAKTVLGEPVPEDAISRTETDRGDAVEYEIDRDAIPFSDDDHADDEDDDSGGGFLSWLFRS